MKAVRNILASPAFPIILGLVVFLALWVSAIPTTPGAPGLTWDETFYLPTYVSVAQWTGQLVTSPRSALSHEGIMAGWGGINELPPVVKWLGALAVSLPNPGGWWNLAMARLVPALAFALTVVLMYLVARRFVTPVGATGASVLYLLHPAIVGHGQLAASETVYAAINMAVLWVALHDLRKWRWKIALVVGIGIALATKVNGVILLATILCWLVLPQVLFKGRKSLLPRPIDWSLLPSLLIVPPLVALALWPWMWQDTMERLEEYYRFIAQHDSWGLWYMGRQWNFNAPPAPWSYPLVTTHLVTPIALLAFFWLAITAGFARFVIQRGMSPGRLLLVMAMLAPMVASSLPNTPKYDGIRLFVPVFAPAAILVAIGIRDLGVLVRFMEWRRMVRPLQACLTAVFLFLLVVDEAPWPNIDHYNVVARMQGRGQTVFPHEVSYWLNGLDARAVQELNELYPPGTRFMPRAFHVGAFTQLQEWGVLDSTFTFGRNPPYDAHLVYNRMGFWGNSDWLMWQEREPLRAWGKGILGHPKVYLFDGRPPGSGPLPVGWSGFPQ
jgi:4-amino-4-deoxy-L-arabinose transferase-like glycosyltransferase